MKYFDDQASPLAPFSGDQSGDIFSDSSDAQSPLASARVVETQSGYLVVLKEIGERLGLSVKRQIGTLPSSQIMLTSDESRRLSKVLDESALSIAASSQAKRRELNRLLGSRSESDSTVSGITGITMDRDDLSDSPIRNRERVSGENGLRDEAEDIEDALRSKKRRLGRQISTGLFALAGVCVFVALSVAFITQKTEPANVPAPAPVVKIEAPKPLSTESVDRFARSFAGNLLDFNPGTYRVSQVQAMADMAPSLMESYWNETSFPLSKKQLQATGEKTLVIERIEQERSGTESKDVNVYGNLITEGEEQGTPVHLLLTIGVRNDGRLTVLEQKDVSTEDENSYAEDVTFEKDPVDKKTNSTSAQDGAPVGKVSSRTESASNSSKTAVSDETDAGKTRAASENSSKNNTKTGVSDKGAVLKTSDSQVGPVNTTSRNTTSRKDKSEDKALLAGKPENAPKKSESPAAVKAPEVSQPASEAPAETGEFGYTD